MGKGPERFWVLPLFVMGMLLWGPGTSWGEAPDGKVPEGVYIELTRDFYEALRNDGRRGARVYSNDPSLESLKQIAISTRFMVETNLEILKMQERILRKLEALSQAGKR